MAGGQRTKASLSCFSATLQPTRLQLFQLLFVKDFITNVILVETNKKLSENPVEYGEFLKWIGLWLLMATIQGPQRRDFWSMAPVDPFDGAPFRLHDVMSRNCFEEILKNLQYTNVRPPVRRDRFWEVQQLLTEWNKNMATNFVPSWVTCLDKSMSTWLAKYTCPGFVFCPRKSWPFGNKYHTICCAKLGI